MSEDRYFEQPELWGHSAESGPHAQRIGETVALVPRSVESLVDLGAGDGALVRHLTATRPEIRTVAVERSRSAIAHIERTRVLASVDQVPLRAHAVDCVTICEVIEHLPTGVYETTLREIARIAARFVIVTVPNREDRRRGRVTCPSCGCRFNRFQHLRSFDPEVLSALLPGFRMTGVHELGPRGVWYPWWASVLAERTGAVSRAGAPICPQCGAGTAPPDAIDGPAALPPVKRLLPRSRRRSWLAAVYEREAATTSDA